MLIDALGVRVPIDLGGLDEETRQAIRDVWRDAIAPPQAGSRETGAIVPRGSELSGVLARLSAEVTLAAIEARQGELWMLHASALALRDGRVIALVAPSGTGKTTAASVLGRRFGYVSDETTAVTPEGGVLPYRKPLSIITTPLGPKAQRAPSVLGLRDLPDVPLRLARVVLLDRDDHAPAVPLIEEVEVGDAIVDLVPQSSYLARMPAPLRLMAAHLEATGGPLRVRYRDAASLLPLFDSLATDAETIMTPTFPVGKRWDPPLPNREEHAARETSYSRIDPLDVVEIDSPDRVVLLHRSGAIGEATVRMLSGIGPAIWHAALGESTVPELLAATIARVGEPPTGQGERLVRDAVEELVAQGVLRQHGEDVTDYPG
ncbi:MAG: hypothetical protein CMO30_07575 [Tistrella sp.]|nr:hypothetical protein [Tistrella sp.]